MDTEKSDDVDALVARINEGLAQAEAQADARHLAALRSEDDMQARLAEANAAVSAPLSLSLPARLLRRILAPLFDRQERQMAAQIQVLNKLVRVLEGRDESWSTPVLEQHHRRVEMLEQLARRLEQCEERLESISQEDS